MVNAAAIEHRRPIIRVSSTARVRLRLRDRARRTRAMFPRQPGSCRHTRPSLPSDAVGAPWRLRSARARDSAFASASARASARTTTLAGGLGIGVVVSEDSIFGMCVSSLLRSVAPATTARRVSGARRNSGQWRSQRRMEPVVDPIRRDHVSGDPGRAVTSGGLGRTAPRRT